MRTPQPHDIFHQLLAANAKAEAASAEWNERDKKLEEGAILTANNRGLRGILGQQYVDSVKEDDKKLRKLFGKQQFWSSEVVRLSSLLQAYTAYQQLNPLWHPNI